MCISRKRKNKLKIYVDGQQVEQVSQLRYLGSLISEDGNDVHERDPEQNWDGEESVYGEKKLFTGKMNLELKKRIRKCLVWSVALYVAETWTLTQTDRRLEAFEMWIWRRMKNISWLDKWGSSQESKRKQANTELYLAKETSMDWPCFETRWTFAWNYWRQNER